MWRDDFSHPKDQDVSSRAERGKSVRQRVVSRRSINTHLLPNPLSRAWPRYWRKRGCSVRAWRCGRKGTWRRRRARGRSRCCTTRTRFAPTDTNCVNSPTFAGASAIAGHSPAEPATCLHERQIDDSRDEAPRIAAPRLTTREGTAPISGDCTVIAAHHEAPADS